MTNQKQTDFLTDFAIQNANTDTLFNSWFYICFVIFYLFASDPGTLDRSSVQDGFTDLAPVAQNVDNAIHWRNLNLVDNTTVIHWTMI